ncbi:mucin-binding protein, partial [Lacticaseibacillus thailandensis]
GTSSGDIDYSTDANGKAINYDFNGYVIDSDGRKGVSTFDNDDGVNQTVVVTYYRSTITVNPQTPAGDDPSQVGPQDPGTPVDPENTDGPKYPAGVDAASLNRTATETVRFINGNTGATVAPSKTATITYHRTASVDVATGTVTYGAWETDNNTFAAVPAATKAGLTPD